MIDRTTKLRFRRKLRNSQKQIEGIGVATEENLERHFFRRLGRLYGVRRFIITWILLIVLLIGGVVAELRSLSRYYQVSRPAAGGVYSEGIIGTFTNASPLYATSQVDASVAHLLFSSLFKYDQSNTLVPDLAEKYDVDSTGKMYTVDLRKNIFWHDGQPFTAADVIYTYKTIQNPDARSPLFSNWQGITVVASSDYVVTFKLPNVLASFPYSMTNGIVPKHILKDTPIAGLRSAPFNTTKPIGTGPFRWETIEVTGNTVDDREQRIGLLPYDKYHDGAPKLGQFIIRTFLDQKHMLKSFDDKELTAISGVDELPQAVRDATTVSTYNVPLTSAVMVFLRTSSNILKDVKVRQALAQATNTVDIVKSLEYPTNVVDEPFLRGQVGYNPGLKQLAFNQAAANTLLDQAGWAKNDKGMRYKDGKPLSISIVALSNPEFAHVIEQLQKQWMNVGVKLEPQQMNELDLQIKIDNSSYDSLMYGISIGNDPDVFPYWHSQSNTILQKRLNFADYASKQADNALEAGRTRLDPALRSIKYKPFLEAWRSDVPAIALYQPRFLYVARGTVFNYNPRVMNTAVDRFSNVQNWQIRTVKQTQ